MEIVPALKCLAKQMRYVLKKSRNTWKHHTYYNRLIKWHEEPGRTPDRGKCLNKSSRNDSLLTGRGGEVVFGVKEFHGVCIHVNWITIHAGGSTPKPGILPWFIFSPNSIHPLWASLGWIASKICSKPTHIVSVFTAPCHGPHCGLLFGI